MALKKFFKFMNKNKEEQQSEQIEKIKEKELENLNNDEQINENLTKNNENKEKKILDNHETIDTQENQNDYSDTKKLKKSKDLTERLAAPKRGFFGKLKEMFFGKTIDDELYEELEELLIQSDIGMKMTVSIVEELEKRVSTKKLKDADQVYSELKDILKNILYENNKDNTKLSIENGKLNILLIVGVNGVGKTTSIGKIANKLKNEGKSVIVGAGDTFRAAAIEQIEEWGKRVGVDVIKQKQGSDPSAVIFDTVSTAKNNGYDIAILDTAGRLHNKTDLMKELAKIKKVITQLTGENDIETLLVIDSTTGQNGLEQAKVFNEIVDLTGIILTKFDGTAKGGIIFPVIEELKKPIKFIGVGEGMQDLREFDVNHFIEAMFE